MNIKRFISSSVSGLILLVAMVYVTTTLTQSVYAYTWPCIDKSEGKAPMAISGNNLYVAWWGNKTGNYEVMFKASNDNGQTFGKQINLSNSTNGTSVRAEVATSGKNVYVTYWDNKTGVGIPYIRTSTDAGKTFGAEITLTDPGDRPAFSAQTKAQLQKLLPYEYKLAASGKNVYVIADAAETNKKLYSYPDIFIKSSNDNGQTFGKEINLSNSTGIPSTRAEIQASGNNVYVTWWEKSDGKDQPMIRISHDGGQTFGKATMLTAKPAASP